MEKLQTLPPRESTPQPPERFILNLPHSLACAPQLRTDFLHLMIRHDHEPENDNADPYLPEFKPEWFDYTKHTIAICEAAKKRQPAMQLYATLYTPPVWMKTNGDPSAGGEARAAG